MKACRLASATGNIYHVHKYDPSSRVHNLHASRDTFVDDRLQHIYIQHLRWWRTGRLLFFTGDRRSDSITTSLPACTLLSHVIRQFWYRCLILEPTGPGKTAHRDIAQVVAVPVALLAARASQPSPLASDGPRSQVFRIPTRRSS